MYYIIIHYLFELIGLIMNCITLCKNCNLCINQKPLLDCKNKADVLWVGLSAKKVDDVENSTPLANDTNTGKIIENIENGFIDVNFYKTNLVKCLPLDSNNKIRYPERIEMEACFGNLIYEIQQLKPKIVFLLGGKVADFVKTNIKNKHFLSSISSEMKCIIEETVFETVHHPSYIHIYKRKYIDDYVKDVQKTISLLFSTDLKYAS